jgi:RNA polymerase sigma-70 factor (ECF subfamily)
VGLTNDGNGDAALVRRVLAGDVEAYAGLVARHRPRLARYALHQLGDPADAEEAVQDALVRAYRALPRCAQPERFGAWVFQILVNRCRTAGARRGRRERLFRDDAGALRAASVPAAAEAAAWRGAIAWALARLDTEQREAFLLKHVEELSYEEMAELTGAGVSALKMRVKRAREHLQVLLAEGTRA